MLPATTPFKSLSRGAIAAVLALGLALPAAPALALDRHEQGIVAGALGLLFIQGMIQASKTPPQAAAQPIYQAQPVEMPRKYITSTRSAPAKPRVARTPVSYAFASYTPSERRAIQRSLARAGYYYGAIDGVYGPATYNATADYARAKGAPSAMRSQAGAFDLYDGLLFAR